MLAVWFSPGPRWAPLGTVLVSTGTARNRMFSGWKTTVVAAPTLLKSQNPDVEPRSWTT